MICTLNNCSNIRSYSFLLRAARKLRLASYESKHALGSLSNKSFCEYLQAQIENYWLYKDALPVEKLLYYRQFLFLG